MHRRAPRAGGGAGADSPGPRRSRRPHSGRPIARGAALVRRRARAAKARGRYRGLTRGAGRGPGRHRQIERWGLLVRTVETVFQGASLASILLLMALGLAIVFGLMGVINMAHGELMALGAYATSSSERFRRALAPAFDAYSWSRCPCRSWSRRWSASCWSAASSAGCMAGRWRRCCSTWGASLIIQQALRLYFGAANVDVSSPTLAVGRLRAHDRAPAAVQPALHHRPGLGERGRHVLAALPHRHRPAHPGGDAEPQHVLAALAFAPAGSTPPRSRSAPVWRGSRAAR